MNHKGHEVSRRILYQQISRNLASFEVQMENRQAAILLGFDSYVAHSADQVTAGVLIGFQRHYFDWVGLVVWTQDQVVPG